MKSNQRTGPRAERGEAAFNKPRRSGDGRHRASGGERARRCERWAKPSSWREGSYWGEARDTLGAAPARPRTLNADLPVPGGRGDCPQAGAGGGWSGEVGQDDRHAGTADGS